MRVFVCLDESVPADAVSCSVGQWVDFAPSLLAGWTVTDLAPVVGALLGLWAIGVLFRVLHRWAQSDIN